MKPLKNRKVLIIALPNYGINTKGYAQLFFPMGLSYISAVLERDGYACDCVDIQTELILQGADLDVWEYLSNLDLESYGLIAFGGTFLDFMVLRDLSARLRRVNPEAPQIAGGNLVSMCWDIILTETRIDVAVIGEGEHTVAELAQALGRGRDLGAVEGIAYNAGARGNVATAPREKERNLDLFPMPDWESWSFETIHKKTFPTGSPGEYSAPMVASRGCPFGCTYCNPITGKLMRIRSPEHIIEEMRVLKARYNVRFIRFIDELFIGSKKKVAALCEALIESDIRMYWSCQTHVRLVDEALLKLMRRSGCIRIGYGVESGNDMILDEMKKGITIEKAREVVELTDRLGINPTINFMAGMPSDSPKTLKDSRDFIMDLNRINWVNIPWMGYLIPIPGTEVFNMAKKMGVIKDEKAYIVDWMSNSTKVGKGLNLTAMDTEEYLSIVTRFNEEVHEDFFRKHPFRKVFSAVGVDHLRWDLILRNFSLQSLKPFMESFLWAIMGKRTDAFSCWMMSRMYDKTKVTRPFSFPG